MKNISCEIAHKQSFLNSLRLVLNLSLTACLLFISQFSFSQAPGVNWQNTIGGSLDDLLICADHTNDGGTILAGGSNSNISGDKTENTNGNMDFWIVKLDSNGNIQWQNTLGGIADEFANSIKQTLDGGYIVAGYSGSGISGDKTEPLIGVYDFWIVRLDSAGNIIWQNTIGGNQNDQATCIRETSDLGFIVVGFSQSGISGDKSEANQGPSTTTDYWVVKLDNTGAIQWENTIGGSYYDYIYAVEQTWEGGYIIGGYSQSGISGDKTEALIGASDYWVLKLNSSGNIQWQNTIGGTSSESIRRILLAPDGGYILAGFSSSDISGDKTEIAYGTGSDYWIVKVSSTGTILWQNDIGGTGDDLLFSGDQTTDGGYIFGGVSYSGLSGDKTENSMGASDYWVIKTDATGAIEWQQTIGGSAEDEGREVVQTDNGGFMVCGFSKSGISGDKTEANMGVSTYDYWAVQLYSDCIPAPEICNSFDDDCNGLIDDGIVETVTISAGGATTFCQGGSVVLSAVYSGTNVQWQRNGTDIAGATSSTFNASQKGNYTCTTMSDCDTAVSSIITIIVNKNPSASITPDGPLTFCAGGSVTLNEAPSAGCSYQWYKGAFAIPGATSTSYVATTTGNYKCRVTKIATGCFKNSNMIAVSVPCRENEIINNQVADDQITIFPNPNNGTFTISINYLASAISPLERGRGVSIEIYNSLNQLIYSKQIDSSGEILETIELNQQAGIYFIRLVNDEILTEKQFIITN